MQFFSKLMTSLGRRRIIYDRETNEPYMIRYYLFLKDRKKFPFNITLHKILKSDDPVLHSHPWAGYATIILWGGYYETLPIYDVDGNVISFETFWRGPGYHTRRKGSAVHYLTLKDNKPCTTLFFMGRQKDSWGFLTARGWIEWFNYTK